MFVRCAMADSTVLTVSGMVASSSVNGTGVGAGTYSLAQLGAVGSVVGTVTENGNTGIPLWSLLGGNSSGNSDVITSTPSADNSKNAILRSYILATSVTGTQSLLSLGEIDPFFGGTGQVPDFISFSAADGKPQLVFPATGASARNVIDLASLQILSAPALPIGAGGTSSSFSLSGTTSNAGIYTASNLQSLPTVTETVSGDTYTGVAFWNLVGAGGNNELNSYVLAAGTDGYEVLYSLAELDPAFGAPQDLIPYAVTAGQFPTDGFARVIVPGDNHQGRWVSNLNSVEVVNAVPEPSAAFPTMLATLICGYWTMRHRAPRRSQS